MTDIQPKDIKDKLSSQDLFVKKVLSTLEESDTKGASPHIIMETPAVFAVPKLSSFKKPADMKKVAKEQEILSIAETPLIMPESSPKGDFLSVGSINSFDNGAETEEVRDNDSESIVRVESEETISPSQVVASNSGKVESVKVELNELPQGNTTESLYASSQDDSRENSVSLLDPGLNSSLQLAEINGKSTILCNGNKASSSLENTGDSYVSQTSKMSCNLDNKQKEKRVQRKKRKSFMLHNDENPDIPVVNKSQSFPEQEISEQLPKRKKLSDVQISISDIQENGTELIGNNVPAENNKESDINMILESEVISQGDMKQASQPRKVFIPDSLVNGTVDEIRISSEIKDGKTKELSSNSNVVLESFDIEKANPNLNNLSDKDIVNDSNLSKQVAEASLVAIAESIQSDISTMDPDSIDIINKPLSQKLYAPETEVVDCSSPSQMTLKPCISDAVELDNKQSQTQCVSQEKNIENQRNYVKGKMRPDEINSNKDLEQRVKSSQNAIQKHRHLSGMLVSPEDLEMAKESKGSLEDIFTIDSEMPIVDCSPMEQTIEQTYGSEDEKNVLSITNVCDYKQSLSQCKEWSRKSQDNSQLQKGSANGEKMKGGQLKNKKETGRTNRNGHGKNPRGNKVVQGMDDSSESDLSQQEKRKRRSGIKAARGFASKKKQDHDSNSDTSSSLRTKSKSASSSVEVENSALTNCSSDNKVQSSFNLDIAAKRSPAGKRGDFDSGLLQTNANDITLHSRTLAKDIPENGITLKDNEVESSSSDSEDDLPELSQKHSGINSRLQNGMNKFEMTEKAFTYSKAEKDADTVTYHCNDTIKSSADMQLSAIKETPNAIANDENASTMESDEDNERGPQDDRNLDNSDTSSSEFQLNSSDDETHKIKAKLQDKEVNKCIKEAKNKILDLEATLSEIKKTQSDEEFDFSTQGSEKSEPQEIESVTADHEKTKENVDLIRLERKFDTSSPLPERNSPEPMEILESDIDQSDTESDDGPVMRKKSRKAVIADSSSDDEGKILSPHLHMSHDM